MLRIPRLLAALTLAAPLAEPGFARAATWSVHPEGSGDAPSIAAALHIATSGDEILLSPGTYFEHDLELVSGVRLRGTTGNAHDVVIDAEALGRVIRAVQAGPGTEVAGITLRGGVVQGDCSSDPGTGAYCMGGAALLIESALSFSNCEFLDNEAEDNGGAIASVLSAPSFSNCRFIGNRATHGGAITFVSSSLAGALPQVQGCVFESNVADADGGAMYAYVSDPLLVRCTFRANESGQQGANIFWYEPTPPVVERCLFAFGQGGEAMFSGIAGAAPTLMCCDVIGNAGGDWVGCLAGQDVLSGNLSSDPLFCATQGADLQSASPCAASSCGVIGAGSAVCATTNTPEEFEMRPWGLVKSAYRTGSAR